MLENFVERGAFPSDGSVCCETNEQACGLQSIVLTTTSIQ